MTPAQTAEIERARRLVRLAIEANEQADAALLALQMPSLPPAPEPPVEPPAPEPPAPPPAPAEPPAPVPPPPPPPEPPAPPPEPPAPPPPEPPAPPPPEPPAPPPVVPVVTIKSTPMNVGALVFVEAWNPNLGTYSRMQGHLELHGPTDTVRVVGFGIAGGGAYRRFNSPEYTITVGGTVVATFNPPSGATSAVVTLDLSAITADVHELLIIPKIESAEVCVPYHAAVFQNGAIQQTRIPFARGSYYTSQAASAPYVWGTVSPAVYAPRATPMPARNYVPFTDTPNRVGLHCAQLVPLRFGDPHVVTKTAGGVLTAEDRQRYFWPQLVSKLPGTHLLDGPRGVGTVAMATHLQVGRGGKVYFCDPWRVGKIMADGAVVTLAGYRHAHPAPHWQSPDLHELVGDWSSIPEERRGFHELWGMAWDERTLTVDEAAPIPPGETEQPHSVGPVLFVADTQNNRVCKLSFLPDQHTTAKVDEFITGMGDPWDCVCADGVLYVSERTSHRISAWDATTGAFIRVVVQGQPLARVDVNRNVIRLASLADCRAAPCVAPEGLFLQDGWLYFGSVAQGQIRKINLATGELRNVFDFTLDGNTYFCKFALSDGTFGPRGAGGVARWSNGNLGWPQMFKPDGTGWAMSAGETAGWQQEFVYVTAVAFGQGRMVFGGANDGLQVISKRLATDTTPSAAAVRGRAEWFLKGLDMVHGRLGFGSGMPAPLPWGESADIDAFLTQLGHVRT